MVVRCCILKYEDFTLHYDMNLLLMMKDKGWVQIFLQSDLKLLQDFDYFSITLFISVLLPVSLVRETQVSSSYSC